MKSFLALFSLLIMTLAHAPAKDARPAVPTLPDSRAQVFTLENGLTLIVEEDHSAPVASVQAWCATGSIDEGKWMGAGLSHILEHMLFKGTQRSQSRGHRTADPGPRRLHQRLHEFRQDGVLDRHSF